MNISASFEHIVTVLVLLRFIFSNAQVCTQTLSVCLEQCPCCDGGVAIKEDCEVSLAEQMEVCTGDGSYENDPTSYVLESRSIETNEWSVTQEGELIFPNRIDATSPKECIQIAVRLDKFQLEYRVTFPTRRGGNSCGAKYCPTELSGLLLHGTCGSEVPTSGPSDNPSRSIYNLRVKVGCLQNLCDIDGGGRTDPYIKVHINGVEVGTTSTKERADTSSAHCWSEWYDATSQIDINNSGSFDFKFDAWDHDSWSSDDRIGYRTMTVGTSQLSTSGYVHLIHGGDKSDCANTYVSYHTELY